MDDQARKQAGIAAEEAALHYLIRQGLKLVTRNYRCRGGELDLIMLEDKTLALIEVRYRSTEDFGGAAASVTWHKQRRIVLAARHLLTTRRELQRFPARFDVIAVSGYDVRKPRIEWIKRPSSSIDDRAQRASLGSYTLIQHCNVRNNRRSLVPSLR